MAPSRFQDHTGGPRHEHSNGQRVDKSQRFAGKRGSTKPSKFATGTLRNRLRDVQRLLRHSDKVPPNARIGYEREMAALQLEIDNKGAAKHRADMIQRYHMVRFFGESLYCLVQHVDAI